MDMVFHRYGGGLSQKSVDALLSMPFRILVRLVGAAVRAVSAGQKTQRRAGEDDAEIIAKLKAKKADLAAVAKAEAMQAARAARAAAAGGHA